MSETTPADTYDAPLDERVQMALHEALGEDDGIHAYEAIERLLRIAWDDGHYCGVADEREDVARCRRNPFRVFVDAAALAEPAPEEPGQSWATTASCR